jgi:transposase, IS5 family
VHADAGYTGAQKREEAKDLEIDWYIAEKRGKILAMDEGSHKDLSMQAEWLKAKIRTRVEHPFHIVKNLFRQRKLRYRRLKKNATHWRVLLALANLLIAKKALLA